MVLASFYNKILRINDYICSLQNRNLVNQGMSENLEETNNYKQFEQQIEKLNETIEFLNQHSEITHHIICFQLKVPLVKYLYF